MLPTPIAIVVTVAQPPADSTSTRTTSRPQRPNPGPKKPAPYSLAAAVEKINWDESRSVLLLVAPERILPASANPMLEMGLGMMDEGFESADIPDALKPRPLPPVPAKGYALDMLATHFNRKLVRAGGVSTLALVDTIDMGSFLDRMEASAGAMGDMGRESVKVLPLLASLSKAQWSAAASPQGLGRESLSPQQAALWESALPMMASFRYPKGKAPERKEPSQEDVLKALSGDAAASEALKAFLPPMLTPDQIAGLRLRLARDLSLVTVAAQVPGAKPGEDDEIGGGMTLDADEPEDEGGRESTREVFLRGSEAMRKLMSDPLSAMMPQRIRVNPKNSDVNPRAGALQVRVPLAGIATVGQLVERISKTVGVPLVADRRYEALTVVLRGESAAAGDLLEALTRALNGAFRKLGEGDEQLFLLADDAVPAARRNGALLDRMFALYGPMARQMKTAAKAGATARLQIARLDPLQLVGRGHGVELPDSLWRAAEKGDDSVRLPLNQTPERYQALARKQWAGLPNEIKSTKLPPDRVYGQIALRVEILWPEVGAVAELTSIDTDDLRVEGDPKPVPPVQWSAKLPVRALSTALPVDAAGRKSLVEAASARGFTHLLVPADAPGALDAVTALAALARPAGLAVIPTLAPLRGDYAPTSVPRDISLRGETVRQWGDRRNIRTIAASEPYFQAMVDQMARADFLVPEVVDPLTVAVSAERLAAVPGVSHVGVRSLAIPGYTGVGSDWTGFVWAGGGTLGARRNFVREHHVDPADIVEGMGFFGGMIGGDLGDPRVLSRMEGEWRKSQTTRLKGLVARLDAGLKRVEPKAPVIALTPQSGAAWTLWADAAKWDPGADDDEEAPPTPGKPKPALPGLFLRQIDPLEMLSDAMRDDSPTSENQLRSDVERFRAFVQENSDAMVSETEDARAAEREGIVLELDYLKLTDALSVLETTVAVQKRPDPPTAKPVAPQKGKKP